MRYDAVIVGAGPAGSAAAITLARSGRSVLVLEKKKFPRHKVCGGCLSGWATDQLRLLLGDNATLPGVPGTHIAFFIGGRRFTTPSAGKTRVALRAQLDTVLADGACRAGAEVQFGQPATVEKTKTGFAVNVAGGHVESKAVLLACGLGGIADELGMDFRRHGEPMIGQQWLMPTRSVGLRPGAVEMHWLRGGYIGLAAPSESDCIVAMAMQQRNLQGEEPFPALRRMNPGYPLWNRFANIDRDGLRGAAGFPCSAGQVARDNLMLLGDASGYAEPFSGTGIALALYSGISAANALISAPNPARSYARAMVLQRKAMGRTRFLSKALSAPLLYRLLQLRIPSFDFCVSALVHSVHVRSAT